MSEEVILEVTTIEENVTIETEADETVVIKVVAPAGPTGATGAAGPNSVTSATTSDGTGQIMLDTLAVGICNILDEVVFDTLTYTFAEGSAQALKDALGISFADVSDAETGTANLTLNNVSTVSFTAGNSSTTSGEITIFTNGPVFQWRSDTVEYGEKGFTFLTTDITSEVNYTLPNASGTIALTTSNVSTATALQNSRNIFGIAFDGTANVTGDATSNGHFASIPAGGQAGHFVTLNGTAPTVVAGRSAWWSDGSGNPSFRNGTGTAVTLVKSSDLGTNVATFLATPTSDNLASALTDENGTGGGFVRAEGASLTTPTLVGTPVFNATSYTYGTGAAAAHRTALGVGTRISALASNTNVTSSTTLQSVASLSVVAGKSYAVYAQIAITGTANTGTRHGITFPASTFIRMTRKRASSYIPTEFSADLNLGIAETTTLAELVGFITVTVSGTVNLLFAQNTSHPDTTTCRTFTFLTLTELN